MSFSGSSSAAQWVVLPTPSTPSSTINLQPIIIQLSAGELLAFHNVFIFFTATLVTAALICIFTAAILFFDRLVDAYVALASLGLAFFRELIVSVVTHWMPMWLAITIVVAIAAAVYSFIVYLLQLVMPLWAAGVATAMLLLLLLLLLL